MQEFATILSARHAALLGYIGRAGRTGTNVNDQFYKEVRKRFGISKKEADDIIGLAVRHKKLKMSADSFGVVVRTVAE